jgi:hypothetical protein
LQNLSQIGADLFQIWGQKRNTLELEMAASGQQCGDGLADRPGFCARFHKPFDLLHANLSRAEVQP